MSIEALVAIAVVVALPFAIIWAIGWLTSHLRARRLGSSPYGWQARRTVVADAQVPQSFWADLKSTVTTPYGSQTRLQRAYAACVLLFVAAVSPMPYEYYFTLRVGVCIALYFFAASAYRQRSTQSGWLAAVVMLMVLYNPIMPFHIGVQLVWTAINAATVYTLYRAKLALDVPSPQAR